MSNFKQKAKDFWVKNKSDIIETGLLIVAVGTAAFAFAKAYQTGFVRGGMVGFHETLNWLDETFPEESKAKALWEAYQQAHPDEVVNVKVF